MNIEYAIPRASSRGPVAEDSLTSIWARPFDEEYGEIHVLR